MPFCWPRGLNRRRPSPTQNSEDGGPYGGRPTGARQPQHPAEYRCSCQSVFGRHRVEIHQASSRAASAAKSPPGLDRFPARGIPPATDGMSDPLDERSLKQTRAGAHRLLTCHHAKGVGLYLVRRHPSPTRGTPDAPFPICRPCRCRANVFMPPRARLISGDARRAGRHRPRSRSPPARETAQRPRRPASARSAWKSDRSASRYRLPKSGPRSPW